MIDHEVIALEAYQQLAEAFSKQADTKPHNAYYERPATLSLLPDLSGLTVLDAGCGPGIYTKIMLDRGAQVVGIDASDNMLAQARQRVGERATFYQANLAQPFHFLKDNYFDIVISPLVIDHVKDWPPLFKEFHRVLKASGQFIFSINNPYFEYQYFKSENYFAQERVECVWTGFHNLRVNMPSYRRPLHMLFDALTEAGFYIEKLIEPLPTAEFQQADPKDYEELIRFPVFFSLRARKI